LSSAHFFEWLRGIHAYYGLKVGVRYGEPYCVKGPLRVRDLRVLVEKEEKALGA
jgi:hypothetical protein